MKIIFLDIDGVLNTKYSEKDEYGFLFVYEYVKNLEHIIRQTNAKIVITSTWKQSGLSIMKELWAARNLPGEVIDITPSVEDVVNSDICEYYDDVTRGMEIKLWLDRHRNIDSYCIIDDINDIEPLDTNKLVLTYSRDYGYGLNRVCANKAIKILKYGHH